MTINSLDLGHNRLMTLSAGVFQARSARKVRMDSLHLESNHFTTLPEHAFANLNGLSTLRLEGNCLTTLPPRVFDGLTFGDNGILDMSQNKLQVLHANTFQDLTFGENGTLDMSQNKLQVLPPKVFHGTGRLEILDLADNELSTLSDDVVKTWINMPLLFSQSTGHATCSHMQLF